jgi:hypothetical protein
MYSIGSWLRRWDWGRLVYVIASWLKYWDRDRLVLAVRSWRVVRRPWKCGRVVVMKTYRPRGTWSAS